jgi:hypothetical protein
MFLGGKPMSSAIACGRAEIDIPPISSPMLPANDLRFTVCVSFGASSPLDLSGIPKSAGPVSARARGVSSARSSAFSQLHAAPFRPVTDDGIRTKIRGLKT